MALAGSCFLADVFAGIADRFFSCTLEWSATGETAAENTREEATVGAGFSKDTSSGAWGKETKHTAKNPANE